MKYPNLERASDRHIKFPTEEFEHDAQERITSVALPSGKILRIYNSEKTFTKNDSYTTITFKGHTDDEQEAILTIQCGNQDEDLPEISAVTINGITHPEYTRH